MTRPVTAPAKPPLPDRLQVAVAELRSGVLSPAALSQAVAAEVAERLRQSAALAPTRGDRRAAIETLHPLATSWCREHIRSLVAALGQGQFAPAVAVALADATYLERVSHLAVESALVNPAAPPLQISPVVDTRHAERLLDNSPTVAVLFDYPLAITHELYPLWTDAFVFGQAAAETPPLEVIGVHASWLDADCRARRAIAYLPAEEIFVEAPCVPPHPFAAGLLLAQSASCHRALSERLREAQVPHVNEWAVAAVADDKWECYRRWRRAGVPTPPTCLLSRADAAASTVEKIRYFTRAAGVVDTAATVEQIRRFTEPGLADDDAFPGGWIIQPRHGTEGRGVSWVSPADGVGRLVEAWQGISRTDDAILRAAVGGVCLGPAGGEEGIRSFDLRLHVAGDGRHLTCESGYLLVAPPGGSPVPSSPSSGGSVLSWARLLEGDLVAGGRPAAGDLVWGPGELESARTAATAAATAVGGVLALCGVDLKFDWHRGSGVAPTVLDLNPRPAGLVHSDLLAAEGSRREAGIARGLWRRLGQLAAR